MKKAIMALFILFSISNTYAGRNYITTSPKGIRPMTLMDINANIDEYELYPAGKSIDTDNIGAEFSLHTICDKFNMKKICKDNQFLYAKVTLRDRVLWYRINNKDDAHNLIYKMAFDCLYKDYSARIEWWSEFIFNARMCTVQ